MKKSIISLAIAVFAVCLFTETRAQAWFTALDTTKANNFYDLQHAFEKYWENKQVEKGQGFNMFKRWENYWEPRVGATGVMPGFSANWNAWNDYQAAQKVNKSLRGAFDSGNWVSVGPSTTPGGYNGIGRVNCITFHPTDSNTFWIGTPAGGLWLTKDFGKTWAPLGDRLPSMGVSDIVVDYTNTNVMYIGTGDRDLGSLWAIQDQNGTGDTKSVGVMKSTDGGLTWRSLSLKYNIFDREQVNRLIMHPTNNKILYAATSLGLYVTNDSGANWTLKKSGYFIDMEMNPFNPNILYASTYSTSAQIFRTTNAGGTWSAVTNLSGAARINLEVTKANSAIVLALVATSAGGLGGIYKSTDSGATFTKIFDPSTSGVNMLHNSSNGGGTGGQGTYDLAFGIHPKNAQIVFLGGINTWLSKDGGLSWTLNNYWTSPSSVPIVHADKHVLAFNPISRATNGSVFEGNDGGILYSRNLGSTWNLLTNGAVIGQVYRVAVSNSGNSILAGHQDNGTLIRSSGTWDNANGGDGMNCQIDQSNANNMYAGVQNGVIIRSTDAFTTNASNISNNIPGTPRGSWVTPYVLDPSNQSIIVAGYADVYRSTNKGTNWTKISTNLTGSSTSYLKSIAVSAQSGNVIFAATYYNIWKTTNGGANWVSIKNGLPASTSITSICLHPTDSKTVWLSYSGYNAGKKVYKTTDGGVTWTNISGTLPNIPVNCIIHEKNSAKNNIYVGTDLGIFVRNDAFGDWVYFSRNLPNVPVADLDISYQGQKIIAGTFGRGVWQSNLWSATPPAAPVAGFETNDSAICQGGTIQFKNKSSNYSGISWTFQGGIPSAAFDTMPSVLYTNSGTFKVTMIANGPGGVDTLMLDKFITVFPLPAKPSITQDTNTLIASVNNNLQWLLNGAPITGATAKTYKATADGSYRVEYTDSNGCKSVSGPVNFKYTRVGFQALHQDKRVRVWPNPTDGKINIEPTYQTLLNQIRVIDITGKVIYQNTPNQAAPIFNIDLSDALPGIYMIETILADGSISYALLSKL